MIFSQHRSKYALSLKAALAPAIAKESKA